MVISSWIRSLPSLITKWRRQRVREFAKGCLRFAVRHCAYLERPYIASRWREGPWAEIILSIKVLVNSLTISFTEFVIGNPQSPGISWPEDHTPSMKLLTDRLYANGWCPFRLRYLTARMTFNTFYYLASLRPNTTRKAEHSECLKTGMCVGDSIPRGVDFQPKHLADLPPRRVLRFMFAASAEGQVRSQERIDPCHSLYNRIKRLSKS